MTREMHDGTGGLLTAALALARDDAPASGDLEALLEEALDDLRLTLDSLRPDEADLPTLLGLLRPRLERQVRSAHLALDWRVSDAGEGRGLPPESFLHVFRIVQEAVTNAVRHAGGTRVAVETRAEPRGGWTLEIRDDGRGGAEGSRKGRGLANLRHRASQLGADLEILSDGAGTRVRVVMPATGR